ncbi:MAG: ABC transporter permease [Alicyclobacillaceae bacterium]|nr:ABC transporter permease [Alicyclobacillaceae bacterium]
MNRTLGVGAFIRKQRALLILVAGFIASSFASPYFLTADNLLNLVSQASINGVIALGMTFVVLSGELDLSVGALNAFSGVLVARLIPVCGAGASMIIAIALGALAGVGTGWLVARLHLNSFVVTLCTMFVFNGLALLLSDSRPVEIDNPVLGALGTGAVLGVPVLIWIFAVLCATAWYVLRYTWYGRNVLAVGGGAKVAELTGIAVHRYKISVFVISGVCAALGGIMLSGLLSSASPTVGGSTALSVITSVVVGGTSLSGGEGGILQTVVGLFVFAVLSNSLSLLNVPSFNQTIIEGLVLVVVVGWDYFSRRMAALSRLAN